MPPRACAARLRGGFVGGTSAAVAVGAHGAGGAMVAGCRIGGFGAFGLCSHRRDRATARRVRGFVPILALVGSGSGDRALHAGVRVRAHARRALVGGDGQRACGGRARLCRADLCRGRSVRSGGPPGASARRGGARCHRRRRPLPPRAATAVITTLATATSRQKRLRHTGATGFGRPRLARKPLPPLHPRAFQRFRRANRRSARVSAAEYHHSPNLERNPCHVASRRNRRPAGRR